MSKIISLDDVSARTALRTRMRAQRTRLGASERVAAANGVVASLELLPEFQVDQRVAGYWAVGGELPLHAAVARLRARGQQYYLPVVVDAGVDAARSLRFAPLYANSALRPNRYGIPEPECEAAAILTPQQIELVLLPLVAFDRAGHRLGMGAGYYDHSFAFLQARTRPLPPLLVGIGYSFQEVDALPAQAHDVPLDYIVTEKELIDCTAPSTNA